MANNQNFALTNAPAMNFRPLLLLIGIAVAVAAGVAVMLWWRGPSWSMLYGNLSAADASQVAQALQATGIEYKLNDASGAIMVPAEKIHEARLQLASQGLPEGGSGIDLISKESGLGVSQFMETARYQYALETELGRTISTLRGVEAARVHLAIPQQSAFVRDRRPATASVLVRLKPNSRLESEQVQSIVHLLASSIPELDSKQVTVVDQQGRLLSSPESGTAAASEQFDAAHRIEDVYVQRVEQLLIPLVGAGRVRAQVAVDLEAGSTEQTREQYVPNSAIVRSEQTSEEISAAKQQAANGGVPGSLSNQPPTGGTVAQTAPAQPAGPATAATAAAAQAVLAVTPENSSRQATRNFEIDRTLSYSKQPGGRIKRVTVAVLLDNARSTAADGKETSAPLSAAQIDDITRLVKSSVGFDETRGDSVSVVNAPFRTDLQTLEPEAVPIWQRPWIQDVVRLALGALLLLALALGVLRPLIRNLTAQTARPALAGAVPAEGEVLPGVPAPLAFEQQIVQARNLVAQDPKRVAQVVKTWVGDR